ncbi:DegT/DnrJ/EryC1/StrS family aminotransferase [Planctomyces sp. SH-PL62]|uniref:DegT/DnrJ/EryC1/StrS family aminotransferase n=1 Tax=Planctomyces sp. SH-PL62 TaxID=1636152 RepID=UPI00078C5A41|nr:DegT/DnrJ/EryC1/StrS family aminotransferase [Planctomyces sp. SH-PL62]AMV37734.1 UDP-4-amino-4-deoxy-L-arabinose--oxoglutarate aminotransferase [Planctomyces sp. SH-PL62]
MRRDEPNGGVGASRRALLGTAAAMAAGRLAGADAGVVVGEPLAIDGGRPAVTLAAARQVEASRWPLYGPEDEAAVLDVLRNPGYGPIDDLERDWRDYFGAPFAKAHCNGTSAIAAMFFALGLPPGSGVMVPSYTFFASIVPMRLFGLVPVFVDVDPRTLNFDVDDARKRLTKDVKALMPVHWMGLPCPMDDVSAFAREKGLILLEDVAHAPGASYRGKLLGGWGRMSIFSYQSSKPLPALEGGMGMYQERADFERATAFGHSDVPARFPADSPYKRYAGTGLGLKLRMNPMAAALARAQLGRLAPRNASGAAQVRRLNDRLAQLPGLIEPPCPADAGRIYYANNILFLDEARAGATRAAIVKALRAEGVQAREHRYPLQHKLPLYAEAEWWSRKPEIPELPGSEQANRTAIALPYFTSEAPELIDQYAQAFEKVWAHRSKLS